jgi:hypothetical protein
MMAVLGCNGLRCVIKIILTLSLSLYLSLDMLHVSIKLIAFELAGEDRDRRENPVLSRLKIAFSALDKRV